MKLSFLRGNKFMAIGDFFKIKQFKENIKKLETENKELKGEVAFKLSVKQMKPLELEAAIKDKKKRINELSKIEQKNKSVVENTEKRVAELKQQIVDLKVEVGDLETDADMSDYGLYKPLYDFATSLEYKGALAEVRDRQKDLVRSKRAVSFDPNWRVNDSLAKGRKMNRNNIKAILRSFNNECTDAIKKVRYSNFERIIARIKKSFDQHNKMYEVVDIEMMPEYLQLKEEEAHIALEYQQKKEEEKEKLREEREKEREEKQLQHEIKEQRKQISKQIDHYDKAISELSEKLTGLQGDEKDSLLKEIEELKSKLADYHSQNEKLDYREKNATAGYVYIISNIGSFGKDVVKIGVTRRLEPLDRINELSSASVPFKFDVHALIFSDDAYALEAKLHNKFDEQRINKVNNRKEYFKIPIKEIERELETYKNVTVDFHEQPEADEYKQTLAVEKEEAVQD
jgi:DNA uptake protein ComE-like DNA-binding protein